MRPSLKRPCTSLLLGGRADAAQVARPVVHYYDSLSLSSPAQERKGKEEESLGWEGLSAGVLPHPPLPRPCCCGSASPPSRNQPCGSSGRFGKRGGGEMRGFLRSSSSGCCRCPRAPPRPRARGAVLRTVSHLFVSQQRQVLLLAYYKECGSPSASRAREARGRIPPVLNWGRWARTLAEGGLLDGGV